MIGKNVEVVVDYFKVQLEHLPKGTNTKHLFGYPVVEWTFKPVTYRIRGGDTNR